MATSRVKCALHPKYAAKRPPTSTRPGCVCAIIYAAKRGTSTRSVLSLLSDHKLFAPPARLLPELDELLLANMKLATNERVGSRRLAQWFAEEHKITVTDAKLRRWMDERTRELKCRK